MMELPNLMQWLNHGGTLKIVGKDNYVVEACLGDAGGGGHVVTLSSSEEIFRWADEIAKDWIEANQQIVDEFKSGSLEWPEDGCMNIPGIGKVCRED